MARRRRKRGQGLQADINDPGVSTGGPIGNAENAPIHTVQGGGGPSAVNSPQHGGGTTTPHDVAQQQEINEQTAGTPAGFDPPSAPAQSGPTVQESSTYRRAARQQARLIQKYALDSERDRLESKHYDFDQQGRITKIKATRKEIKADLKQARQNVKKTTELLFSSPRVYRANVKGKVVSRKKIERIEAARVEKIHEYNQAKNAPKRHTRQREEMQKLRNETIPKLQRRQARLSAPQSALDISLTGPTELDRKNRLTEVTGKLEAAETEAQRLSGLVKTRRGRRAPPVTPEEVALALASAVPVGRLGSAAWKAAVAARAAEGTAVTSQAAKVAAEKLLPQAVRSAGGASVRGLAKVPGLRNLPEGLRRNPFRTTASTSLKGGLAFGAATNPKQAVDLTADVGEWLGDLPEYKDRVGDAANFFATIPEAIEKTAEELATSGEARRQTLFGARDLAFGASAFPFIAGYEAVTEGPQAAVETFGKSIKHDFRRTIGPALRDDWDTFQERMNEPGMGGAAIPLSFLIPGAALASRGSLLAGKGLARVTGGKEGAATFADRSSLRFGPGVGQVQHYPGGERGLFPLLAHKGLNATRRGVEKLRPEGSKSSMGPRPGEVGPLFPGFGINHYRRGRSAAKIPAQETAATGLRARELIKGGQSLEKIAKRNSKHEGLFGWAIELGSPKDAPSMIAALRAKLADVRREAETSNHPSAGANIPQLEKLIADLERNPRIIDARFKADVERANEIVRFFEEEAGFLDTRGRPGEMSQTELRHYAEQAEQLSKRGDSQLPPLEEALPPIKPTDTTGHQARVKQARSELETARTGRKEAQRVIAKLKREVEDAQLRLDERRHRGVATKADAKYLAVRQRRLAQARKTLAFQQARAKAAGKEYSAAKKGLKEAKTNQPKIRPRTWAKDARSYVAKVGKDSIDAEAQRRGLGEPGYFPAFEAESRPIAPTKSQTKSKIVPQKSQGQLARVGAKDVSSFRLPEMMHRLNRTIGDIRAHIRAEEELMRDPAEIVSVLRGKEAKTAEFANMTSQQLAEALVKEGLDLTHLNFINAKSLAKKLKVAKSEATKGGGLGRMTDEKAAADVAKMLDDAIIKGEDARAGKTSESLESDNGWMLIGDIELSQFRGAYRPYGHMGESGPPKVVQVWTRAKTLASRYLLAHPSWAAFQAYANFYLAGISEPGALVGVGYKKWLKSMNQFERENFERALGIPLHHPDVGNQGGSLIAGWTGMTKYKNADWYQRHLKGKNPLDAFYGAELAMERAFKARVLHTKAKRAAYARMGGHMNKILTIMDKFTGGKLNRVEDYNRVMHEMLADPKAVERLGQETSSFMGDYLTFNQKERTFLANNVLFYGFIRHSLMLTLYTLPVKHPLRTGLIAQMGSMVNKEQKKNITRATKDWLREMMLNMGYSPENASHFANQFELRDNSIPMSMLGSFVLPDGTIIDLKRASFAGSLPTSIQSPYQLASGLNPLAQFIGESFTGMDFFTGQPIQTTENFQYRPGFSREDPLTPGPETVWGDPTRALPQFAATSIMQYLPGLRMLSDATAEFPASERTGLSFPLPGPINPFPEVPFIHKSTTSGGRIAQGERALKKQIQYEAKHGWRSVAPELFPFLPHETAAIPGVAMSWLYEVSKKSEEINSAEAKAEEKKPDKPETGYGAITLPGESEGGYDDILLPGEKSKAEKEADDETTYAESLYKVLRNVFDVADAPPDDLGKNPKKAMATQARNNTPDAPKRELTSADTSNKQPRGYAKRYGITPAQAKAAQDAPTVANREQLARVKPGIVRTKDGDLLSKAPDGTTTLLAQAPLTAKGGPEDPKIKGPKERRVADELRAAKVKADSSGVPSIVPEKYRASVAKWGSQPEFEAIAAQHGITGPELMAKVVTGESNWNPAAESYAGAKSWTQFIDSTRDDFIETYGFDPTSGSFDDAVHGTFLHMTDYQSTPGIAGYNPGMPDYTEYILGQNVGDTLPGKPIPKQLEQRAEQVLGQQKTKQILHASSEETTGVHPFLTAKKPAKVEVYDGANREGVPLTQDALDFASSAAAKLRKMGVKSPPVVTTGSNHDQYSSSGNVSDHWDGNGMDFGLAVNSGNSMDWGDDFATAAIEATGVPADEARAMATGGGIHDLPIPGGGSVQIIWRAADHYDHVHIGVQPGATSAATSTGGGVAIPSSGSYVPSAGTTSTSGSYTPAAESGKAKKPKPRFSEAKLLQAIGKDQGFNEMFGVAAQAPTEEDATMAAMAEIASTRKRLLKR